jgi:hypothetical protein
MISIHFSRALKLTFGFGLSAFLLSRKRDRACLKADDTLPDAVVAHDPAAVPMTADVRFTEDSKDLKVGEGLWKTAKGRDLPSRLSTYASKSRATC